MTKVQAWERLNDPSYHGNMTMGELKELALAAGYSEAAAQRMASHRGWERLSAGATL